MPMDKEMLIRANVDYENGKKRFAGNEALYEKYLLKFREDTHYELAKRAFEAGDYETLLKETHTLKGVAGTLGLQDLYQSCAVMVIALRENSLVDVPTLFLNLQQAYDRTMEVLQCCCS